MEDQTKTAAPSTRKSRKPFGSHMQKLAYEPRSGYHRHWFNDTPGRLDRAVEAGYQFVMDKGGQRVARPVGVGESGGALMAYLLEIPEEWYKEDMAAEQQRIDDLEQNIAQGADAQGRPGQDGRYIPATGIKISHGNK